MTDLVPISSLDAVVQLETDTVALAGAGGAMNVQAQSLLNRTQFLDDARILQASTLASLVASNLDLADSSDIAKGGARVGYRGRTVTSRLDDVVVVNDYGPVDTPTNTTSTIMAAWTAATMQGKELWFIGGAGGGTNGRYEWTGGNLGASYLTIRAIGKVELNCVGAGRALDINPGAGSYYRFNILGEFKVTGNALTDTTGAVLLQAINHGVIELDVWNVPGLAIFINSGVLTDFKLRVTSATQGGGIVPTAGLKIDGRTPGDYLADCHVDCIMESVSGGGVDIVNANGCTFVGTSEGNGGFGLREQASCRNNEFTRFWCEGNGSNDFIVRSNSTYNSCRALSSAVTNNVEVEGAGAKFRGGYLRCVNLQVGSTFTDLDGVELSDHPSLGIKAATTNFTRKNCVKSDNVGVITGRFTDVLGGLFAALTYDPPSLADGAGVSVSVTVAGAVLGDYAVAAFTTATAGITITANVTSADTVTVRFQNETGGAIDLSSGSLRVKVFH